MEQDTALQARLADSGEITLEPGLPVLSRSPAPASLTPLTFRRTMQYRAALLTSQCSSSKQRPGPAHTEVLYVLPARGLVWCPVYKAGYFNFYFSFYAEKKRSKI